MSPPDDAIVQVRLVSRSWSRQLPSDPLTFSVVATFIDVARGRRCCSAALTSDLAGSLAAETPIALFARSMNQFTESIDLYRSTNG
ncbi:hypothetical protein N9485_03300 [Luminiphilus sp.]|nr:hypothetical protein [Luminiphilus sp.]